MPEKCKRIPNSEVHLKTCGGARQASSFDQAPVWCELEAVFLHLSRFVSQNPIFSMDGFPYMISCKKVDGIEQRSDALDCSRVEVNRYVAPNCVKKYDYWDHLDVSSKSISHKSWITWWSIDRLSRGRIWRGILHCTHLPYNEESRLGERATWILSPMISSLGKMTGAKRHFPRWR